MENIKDTTYDFVMVLRQKYTEKILREKLEALSVPYIQSAECIGFTISVMRPRKRSVDGQAISLARAYTCVLQ